METILEGIDVEKMTALVSGTCNYDCDAYLLLLLESDSNF